MKNDTTPPSVSARLITPKQILMLASEAKDRDFGMRDDAKRAYILHGYLLALEEVMRG